MTQSVDAAAISSRPRNVTLALFLISVLGLFLELLLIRWVSTEIRIFAYLQNTILVVCFLGLGMGCWDSARRPFVLRDVLLPLAILVGLLAVPTTRIALGEISTLLNSFEDMEVWGSSDKTGMERWLHPALGLILTFLLLVLVWDIFVPFGRLLGRLLADHPHTIWAYSVNIAGSLLGIWLFVILSAWYLPPIAWFGVFAALALYFLGPPGRDRIIDLALLAFIVGAACLAGWEVGSLHANWSPYQKLVAYRIVEETEPRPVESSWWSPLKGQRSFTYPRGGQYVIMVNNFGYQNMIDLEPTRVAKDPDGFAPKMRGYSQYDVPAKLHPSPKKVLIVGAGSGNDVAGALRNGAEEVVAVEIDPVIIELGKQYHPEKPYDAGRVRIVNDDARSFFATTNEKFDLIVFGLLDSHTTTAMTNARLDHYVYTRESLEHAKSLLNPGGVIVLSFWAEKDFITDRMATALTDVFRHKPLTFTLPTTAYGWGGMHFVTGDMATVDRQLAADPGLKELIREWQEASPIAFTGTTQVSTDDWPYLYLPGRRVPTLYLLLAGVLLLLFLRGIWRLGSAESVRGWDRQSWHFFFLGAAFMLLEVQNVSKAAVVLGNTWVVNAVIISGILAMVLLANGLAWAWPNFPVAVAYAGLIGACVGLYFLDLSSFAFLPYTTKALIVGALTSLPMLFSGLVFIRSFAAAERKDVALGANLFGSLVGGLLQSATFVVGIKALLIVVAVLYGAALLTRPRQVLKAALAA